jgi:hypothetical protein
MFLVLGELDRVEPCVAAAERGSLPGPMRDGSSSVEASAAMLRTSCRLMLGDVGAASETARRAAELEQDVYRLEDEKTALEEQMAHASAAGEYMRLAELARDHKALLERLEAVHAAWLATVEGG